MGFVFNESLSTNEIVENWLQEHVKEETETNEGCEALCVGDIKVESEDTGLSPSFGCHDNIGFKSVSDIDATGLTPPVNREQFKISHVWSCLPDRSETKSCNSPSHPSVTVSNHFQTPTHTTPQKQHISHVTPQSQPQDECNLHGIKDRLSLLVDLNHPVSPVSLPALSPISQLLPLSPVSSIPMLSPAVSSLLPVASTENIKSTDKFRDQISSVPEVSEVPATSAVSVAPSTSVSTVNPVISKMNFQKELLDIVQISDSDDDNESVKILNVQLPIWKNTIQREVYPIIASSATITERAHEVHPHKSSSEKDEAWDKYSAVCLVSSGEDGSHLSVSSEGRSIIFGPTEFPDEWKELNEYISWMREKRTQMDSENSDTVISDDENDGIDLYVKPTDRAPIRMIHSSQRKDDMDEKSGYTFYPDDSGVAIWPPVKKPTVNNPTIPTNNKSPWSNLVHPSPQRQTAVVQPLRTQECTVSSSSDEKMVDLTSY